MDIRNQYHAVEIIIYFRGWDLISSFDVFEKHRDIIIAWAET